MQKPIESLTTLTDTRRQWGNICHKLVDIVFIGLVSVICGGTDCEHMEDIGYANFEWFQNILELPNGVPYSDTFQCVFERLDPQELATVLQDTMGVTGKTVALGGKTICGNGNGQHRAYHVVGAWVTENQLTLGQLATEEKSYEIMSVPELLDILEANGSAVASNAMK